MTEPAMKNHLEKVAFEKLFSTWGQDFVNSPKGAEAVDEVLYQRQERAETYAVKWLNQFLPLREATVVEVGCGTGAASIPLARICKRLVGLDIDHNSIEVAKARAEYCGARDNVEFLPVVPEQLLDKALVCVERVDVFVLYAVLEHLTPLERLHYLQAMWKALPEGGAIVVIETPNRLTWEDKHTAYMDFFHMLPDEYVRAYAERSPRPYFAETMKGLDEASFRESRYRWGMGASFHEFELAFSENLNEVVVADGLEQEMTSMFPIEADEVALRQYFIRRGVAQPIGFSRAVLNLIFQKPSSATERHANVNYNERSLARERAKCLHSDTWYGRMRQRFFPNPETAALMAELEHARQMANDRYLAIQQMDQMLHQRDAEIAALSARLRDVTSG
jgi:2-polyprenyl-3-methyl-5-hydroxy-6-metoxy-1,4-benzoquinol methylase